MEIFPHQPNNVYAEAKDNVICLALSIETSKAALPENCRFLRLICESLTQKMESITTIDAAPASYSESLINIKLKER